MILAVSNARTCGIMESLCAVGMVVGSIWIGVAGIRGEHRKVLRLAGILCGFFMAVAGINKNLLLTGIGIFLFFLCLPFMNTCGDVLVRVSIPNEMQGRVWGMISLLTQAGTVAAYISCGVLADYIFEPMFVENGLLFLSIGRIIGTGEGRGIGFMLILAGLGMAAVTLLVCRSKGFQATDTEEK